MGKNVSRFKLSNTDYYRLNEQFTIHNNGVLNVFDGEYKDTNLLYINSGYSKKNIFFRLSVLVQISPVVIFLPISLRRIKDPILKQKIKDTREYILLKHG